MTKVFFNNVGNVSHIFREVALVWRIRRSLRLTPSTTANPSVTTFTLTSRL